MIELDGAAENRSQAEGVSPSVLGSPEMFSMYLSRWYLKSSTGTLVIFLRDGGRELNSLGPLT